MTPEEKREKLLKQLLPLLAILVIYFIFFSGIASDGSKKAKTAYTTYANKGGSRSALPALSKQRNKLNQEINGLKKKDEKIRASLMQESIFSSQDTANATIERVSYILDKYQLRVIQESAIDNIDTTELSMSLRDIEHWLTDVMSLEDSSLKIIRIQFQGSYEQTYKAMMELSNQQLKTLPISFTMKQTASNRSSSTGELEWVLQLWI